LASSQVSASRLTSGDTIFMNNTHISSSHDTKFNIRIVDSEASSSTLQSTPTMVGFDLQKTYEGTTDVSSHSIGQSMVFSSYIKNNSPSIQRFLPGGGTPVESSGSAIYHFQSILDNGQSVDFDDGRMCVMRIDADVYALTGGQKEQWVFMEGRAATSTTYPKRLWQIQHDGDIVTKGNVTAFGALSNFLVVSDERLKTDVHTMSGSMDKILQLRPTEFTWKENQKQDVGFIAQEVEEIIPEVIEVSEGFINTDGEPEDKETEDIKTIAYPKLVPYLVDTIQQLNKRVKELEKKVK